MNANRLVRNIYVLPCCVLLLNLCLGLVSYKAKLIGNTFLRTGFIMAMVLFGSSLIGFVMEPAIQWTVGALHQRSRRRGGRIGEFFFLAVLGAAVFVLYYRMYIYGPRSILPAFWWN